VEDRLLTEDELNTVAGGRTNGEDPFVRAVMAAFFCAGTTTTTYPIATPNGTIIMGSTQTQNCTPA
jgi:hypothetical protein